MPRGVRGVGSENFPVNIQDGGVDAVLDVFFDLVEALGDLLGAGAEGGDGPGGAVQCFVVGGFGDGEVGFFAPDGFHGGEGFAFGFVVFAAVELEVQGEDAYVGGDVLVLLWGFAFFQQFSQGVRHRGLNLGVGTCG